MTDTRASLRLHVHGMDCADEASLVRHVLDVPGVLTVEFDLVGRRVDVVYDPSMIEPDVIVERVAATGLGTHTHADDEQVHDDHRPADHGRTRWWTLASALLMLGGWAVDIWSAESWIGGLVGTGHGGDDDHAHPPAATAAYAAAVVVGLAPVLPRAVAAIRHRRLDMHVLVVASALGAAAVGQWGEGAAVACLFGVAHLMEAWSIDRARRAVAALVGHEPGWGADGAGETAAFERFIERFANVYTPVVATAAIALATVPPLVDGHWGAWFYRALIFLVLACPCALVISTPVTVVAAVTSAAGRGVLFRGGLALERAAVDLPAALERREVILTPGAAATGPSFAGDHARRALTVIRQNVALALLTKVAFLVSAVLGAAPLWLAVLADTGATVAVTLNGLRLLRA